MSTRDELPSWVCRTPPKWEARNFVCDRPDRLRLSVSLGTRDGGFHEPTWSWFVYDLNRSDAPTLSSGKAETLEGAQASAGEYADRRSGRVCSRCGLTETEIANASDRYCDSAEPNPARPEEWSQHHIGKTPAGAEGGTSR